MHEYTEYFKNKIGFDRFIRELYNKYRSLSRFSGSIALKDISLEEAITFSSFFGTTYREHDDVKLPIKKFINVMAMSKFTEFDISVLVSEYLKIDLKTKNEQKAEEECREKQFYRAIYSSGNSVGKRWLKESVTHKKTSYRLIQQRYKADKKSLRKELINIITLLDNLPNEKTLLPVFASKHTGNPHYLDLENSHNGLFMSALSEIDQTSFKEDRENKIKLLSKYNIEIDSISNFVITYNLYANKSYINEFAKNNETLILNIQNIISCSYFDSPKKKVFVFENPSILSIIISNKLDVSIIISGGFPNMSVYMLLDKLLLNGNEIFYNGDFDPEGIIIAAKLKEKYKNKIKLICYNKNSYKQCQSSQTLSESRLKKLSKVTINELAEIKDILLTTKCAGYQENNESNIIKAIKEIIEKK